MTVQNHTITTLDPQPGTDFLDRVIIGQKVNQTGPTGAGTQTQAVTFLDGLPSAYGVFVSSNIQCQIWVTNKTSTGFTLNFNNGGTIPANTYDVLVVGA